MKHLISESEAAAIARFIRPYVRPDPYCELQPEGAYPIVTLYLDSKDFQLCRESFEGKQNRFKLRIRGYSDNPEQEGFASRPRQGRCRTPVASLRAAGVLIPHIK